MKKVSFTALVVFVTLNVFAQQPLLEERVYEDTIMPVYGPNLKHYLYSYVGYALVAGPSEAGLPVKYGNAGSVVWGIKYKYRLANSLALGVGLSYSAQYFPLKQDSSKTYPDNILHQKERYSFNNLGADVFTRFNFDRRRGNVIGKYMDVGLYGDWAIISKYYTKDKSPAGSTSKHIETSYTGLVNVNKFNYGIMAKIGYKGFSVFAKYRVSDVFVESYALPELPRLMVGVEIGTIN